MKKLLAILLASVLLSACSDSTSELRPGSLPDGLKDCKFYEVYHNLERIVVVRCPLSSVGTQVRVQNGKTSVTHDVLLTEGE